MYDLMGKAVGQPCHTLFGPQCRGYVPVSSWFNATSPARMAEAVQYYAAMGHTYGRTPCLPRPLILPATARAVLQPAAALRAARVPSAQGSQPLCL